LTSAFTSEAEAVDVAAEVAAELVLLETDEFAVATTGEAGTAAGCDEFVVDLAAEVAAKEMELSVAPKSAAAKIIRLLLLTAAWLRPSLTVFIVSLICSSPPGCLCLASLRHLAVSPIGFSDRGSFHDPHLELH
jgi:hypothetical protein